MYIVFLFLIILILVLIFKALKQACVGNSETAPAVVSTTTTTTPAVSATSVANQDSLPCHIMHYMSVMQHRSAMGNILVDDNNNDDDDDDEIVVDDIDLNASSANLSDKAGATCNVLSADFGDDNVHPIEEICCSICLVNYHHGDRIQRNALDCSHNTNDGRCDHIFHPECITNWIKTATNSDGECPICRRPFVILPPV